MRNCRDLNWIQVVRSFSNWSSNCGFSIVVSFFLGSSLSNATKFNMKTENEDGSTMKSTIRYTFCAAGVIGKGRGRDLRSLTTKGKTLTKSSFYQPGGLVKQYTSKKLKQVLLGKGEENDLQTLPCVIVK
ncbi:hypothetical protein P3L10_018622 [Capsicum annuum]